MTRSAGATSASGSQVVVTMVQALNTNVLDPPTADAAERLNTSNAVESRQVYRANAVLLRAKLARQLRQRSA